MRAVDFSGARWRKARASDNQNACVEVAHRDGVIGMRDSKDPEGPVLRFTAEEWSAFLAGIQAGEFESLDY